MSTMNVAQAANAIKAYNAANIPAFIWGAPGIGKSDIVAQVAAEASLPLIDVRAVLLDPVDVRGLPAVQDGRAVWAQPDFLPRADRDGPAGILFLDELNAAPMSVQAAFFQLVLNRRIGEYQLPDGWRIVAAGNRQSDRAAAQRMPSALANRFAHIDVEADVQTWKAWAMRVDLNPLVVAFIDFRKPLLHLMPGAKPDDTSLPAIPADARAFPTPRAWASVAKVADAPDDIRPALVAGLVGEGPAAEFEGFVRVWRNLPSIADIIANPDRVTIPNDPATLFAVSGALARKAERKTFDSIMRFARRALGPEFTILMTMDATARDAGLKETRAFVDWATENQGVAL